MICVIDVGNTQTVFGWYDADLEQVPSRAEQGLRYHLRLTTDAARTPDEYVIMVSQFLSLHEDKEQLAVSGVAIASSAPSVTAKVVEMVRSYFHVEPSVLTGAIDHGLVIRYDNPQEVGADRIADAIAALDLHGAPAVVVDFGTATTFDVIDAAGDYRGGAILPGVEVSLDALVARAGALRKVDLIVPPSVIGTTTVTSLQSGAIFGVRSQVEGMVAAIRSEIGSCPVIATGGLASVLAPHIGVIDYEEPWLTLHGLRLVYRRLERRESEQ